MIDLLKLWSAYVAMCLKRQEAIELVREAIASGKAWKQQCLNWKRLYEAENR